MMLQEPTGYREPASSRSAVGPGQTGETKQTGNVIKGAAKVAVGAMTGNQEKKLAGKEEIHGHK